MRDWDEVELGHTTAEVRRSPDGSSYAKTAYDAPARAELADERDRASWLAGTGLPGPRVLDWVVTDERSTLVTSAVPGLPASDLPRHRVPDALPAIARLLRSLHDLPVATCPFDRRLAVTVPAAVAAVAAGLVDGSDLDAERWGRSPADLLAELTGLHPVVAAREAADLVVCHGDACLPNLVLDPETLAPTGFVDLGRLGVADRYQDLALLTRSMATRDLNPQYGGVEAAATLAAYGLDAPDEERLAFYRLLDEFF